MFERGTTTITVKFSHREDGGLRVESQDVPGLFLSISGSQGGAGI